MIEELDEKKREALRATWQKVNTDFGAIFSTLLPGTMAKLEPPEGQTFLDGLEVRWRTAHSHDPCFAPCNGLTLLGHGQSVLQSVS